MAQKVEETVPRYYNQGSRRPWIYRGEYKVILHHIQAYHRTMSFSHLLRACVAVWLHPSHCYACREYSAGVTPSQLYTCACTHVNLGQGATLRRLRRLLGDLCDSLGRRYRCREPRELMHLCIHLIIRHTY